MYYNKYLKYKIKYINEYNKYISQSGGAQSLNNQTITDNNNNNNRTRYKELSSILHLNRSYLFLLDKINDKLISLQTSFDDFKKNISTNFINKIEINTLSDTTITHYLNLIKTKNDSNPPIYKTCDIGNKSDIMMLKINVKIDNNNIKEIIDSLYIKLILSRLGYNEWRSYYNDLIPPVFPYDKYEVDPGLSFDAASRLNRLGLIRNTLETNRKTFEMEIIKVNDNQSGTNIKILCISDIHDNFSILELIKEKETNKEYNYNIVIFAGDLCYEQSRSYQDKYIELYKRLDTKQPLKDQFKQFINSDADDALKQLKNGLKSLNNLGKNIYLIPGNHDYILEKLEIYNSETITINKDGTKTVTYNNTSAIALKDAIKDMYSNIHYISHRLDKYTYKGIQIWGSGISKKAVLSANRVVLSGNTAFQEYETTDLYKKFIKQTANNEIVKCDILVTHGPLCTINGERLNIICNSNTTFVHFLNQLAKETNAKLLVCGHEHVNESLEQNNRYEKGVINAALFTIWNKPYNKPCILQITNLSSMNPIINIDYKKDQMMNNRQYNQGYPDYSNHLEWLDGNIKGNTLEINKTTFTNIDEIISSKKYSHIHYKGKLIEMPYLEDNKLWPDKFIGVCWPNLTNRRKKYYVDDYYKKYGILGNFFLCSKTKIMENSPDVFFNDDNIEAAFEDEYNKLIEFAKKQTKESEQQYTINEESTKDAVLFVIFKLDNEDEITYDFSNTESIFHAIKYYYFYTKNLITKDFFKYIIKNDIFRLNPQASWNHSRFIENYYKKKKTSNYNKYKEEWRNYDMYIMQILLYYKSICVPLFKERLLETKDKYLIEFTYNNNRWGIIDFGQTIYNKSDIQRYSTYNDITENFGENLLGISLMIIRMLLIYNENDNKIDDNYGIFYIKDTKNNDILLPSKYVIKKLPPFRLINDLALLTDNIKPVTISKTQSELEEEQNTGIKYESKEINNIVVSTDDAQKILNSLYKDHLTVEGNYNDRTKNYTQTYTYTISNDDINTISTKVSYTIKKC